LFIQAGFPGRALLKKKKKKPEKDENPRPSGRQKPGKNERASSGISLGIKVLLKKVRYK
jgi:hypothetical protein